MRYLLHDVKIYDGGVDSDPEPYVEYDDGERERVSRRLLRQIVPLHPKENKIEDGYQNKVRKSVESIYRRLARLSKAELYECFDKEYESINVLIDDYTSDEIQEMFDKWDKRKKEKELHPGDVVISVNHGKGVIVNIMETGCHIIWYKGTCGYCSNEYLEKTGENRKDVTELMRVLRKESDW